METALNFVPLTLYFLGVFALHLIIRYARHFYKGEGSISIEPITNLTMAGLCVYMAVNQTNSFATYAFLLAALMTGFGAANTSIEKSPNITQSKTGSTSEATK